MNRREKEKKELTKNQLLIMLILVLFFSITGATYAYFVVLANNGDTITGNAATVDLTLSVDRVFPASDRANTGVIVPQLSISGNSTSPLANALKVGCVDDNQNVVCQVYKIVIQNKGGTATQVVDGTVSFYGDSAMKNDVHETIPNLKWKLITSVDTATLSNSQLGTNIDREANSNNNKFVSDLTLVTDARDEYYMIVWLNETGKEQLVDEGNTFYGLVQFSSSNGTGVTATFAA